MMVTPAFWGWCVFKWGAMCKRLASGVGTKWVPLRVSLEWGECVRRERRQTCALLQARGGEDGLRKYHLFENHLQNETPESLQVSGMLHNLIIRSSLLVFLECYESSFVLGLPFLGNMHSCIFLLVELPKLVSISSVRPKGDGLWGVVFQMPNHFLHLPFNQFYQAFSQFPIPQRKCVFIDDFSSILM